MAISCTNPIGQTQPQNTRPKTMVKANTGTISIMNRKASRLLRLIFMAPRTRSRIMQAQG